MLLYVKYFLREGENVMIARRYQDKALRKGGLCYFIKSASFDYLIRATI